MKLRPEEISSIIKEQIRTYDNRLKQAEVGTVILVGDGIAKVHGLENCMANELLVGRIKLKGGALTAPVPPALVTVADGDEQNVLTVAWTGILATVPPRS